MEQLSISEILNATSGYIYKEGEPCEYSSVSTDTRKLERNSIFIALKGDNFNGNEYAAEAVKKGAVLCIVDEIRYQLEELDDRCTIIKVEDCRKALRELARYYRSKLDIKIIGVTGSTGKTSTKDLVAAVLGSKFKVFKTKGNFNNDIGLPLMIFNLDSSYEAAVLEMGMNNLNEIHLLADIAKPDVAIITNIGISHIENLITRENILKAKMEITDFFDEKNVLIINGDNDLLSGVGSECYRIIKIGIDSEGDYRAQDIVLNEESIEFNIRELETGLCCFTEVPAVGRHNVLNSLLAAACGRVMGMSFEEIARGIKELQATSMRLDIVRLNTFTIIDDSYNASPDSMKAALDVLVQMKGNRKIAVLGTMRELGDAAFDAHRDVGRYASLRGVSLLLSLGEFSSAYSEGFGSDNSFRCFGNISELIDFLRSTLSKDDVILVKASRAMKFEVVVQALKAMAVEGGEILH